MPKTYVGFDIGASAVHISVCTGTNVRRLISEPLPDGLVRDGQITSMEAMADFLKSVRKRCRIRRRRCSLVLPAGLTFCRRLTMPAMTVDQLKLNLPYEFRDYLVQDKDKYVYDYSVVELRKDESGTPVELDLMAAATLRSTIEDYIAMFRRAGFRLKVAMPVELAYLNLLRQHDAAHPEALQEGHCIVDFGHTATRVYMFNGVRFEVLRTIDRGCALLDEAIADELNVDVHIAHTYRLTNHDNVQELDICHSFYNSVAVEIMKAVNFYSFNNRDGVPLSALYCCGGGAKLPALLEAVSGMVPLSIQGADALFPPPAEAEDAGNAVLSPAAAGAAML